MDSTPENWIATLPDEVKGSLPEEFVKDAEITKYKTLPEFVKSYHEKTELVGRKGIIIPKEGDAPEIVAKYREAMGIPEKPDGYKFSELKDIHPSLKVTPESQKAFMEAMHKSGVPAQYADLFNQFGAKALSDMIKAGEKATVEAQTKALGELKAEWGDKYETNLKGAQTLVQKVLGDKAGDLGRLEDSPSGLRFLHKLSTVISEDAISKIVVGGGAQMPDQEAALKELKEILDDAKGAKQHPMNNEKHPDHRKWNGAEGLWTKLNQRAYKPEA